MPKTKKNTVKFSLTKNSFNTTDGGNINFSSPVTITDNKEQHNGTRYDIKSMDISGYDGLLTANHSSDIREVIGKVKGLKKVANNKVVITGLDLAVKENALALYSFNMIKAGYLTDFSIETLGSWPDDDGVYFNSKLVGNSLVASGNNKSAAINSIFESSIAESKRLGLDTSIVEDNFVCYSNSEGEQNSKKEDKIMFVTIKNNRSFALTVKYTNAAGDECTKILNSGETIDVAEDQKEDVEAQVEKAVEPKSEKVEDKKPEAITKESLDAAVAAAIEKNNFDRDAKQPEFKKAGAKNSSKFQDMDWRERQNLQVRNAWDWLKGRSQTAQDKLIELNKINLEKLQEAEIVSNVITIADMGNFVISPELLSEIEGHRSDFSALLAKVPFQETLSLQMSWLKRSGDIAMSEVEMCDDGADGNLKPISEYGSNINTSNLHELAAVTPICNAATRFLAVDLMSDAAAGYRNDYDRKRSQLFIAKLQGAVNATGNKIPYDGTTDVTTLQSWIDTSVLASEEIMNGVFVFNNRTYGELRKRIVGGGISGPLGSIFTTGTQPLIDGRPFIVVPNELMPTLNTAETKSFTVEGSAVTIDQGVFYVDFSTFSGRTSGGLQFDLSTEAAYEDGGTVKSAFQRNELLLRGSFFRGGAIRDDEKVSSMFAAGVS